ncbi:hypothetical protein [Sporosarcina sp. SAFN-015]|uniref:hypothetical protein n=1 Tax=Sporosarcina sp. SAFN-015 TaxID=3387274 RepID=UPI003F81DD15
MARLFDYSGKQNVEFVKQGDKFALVFDEVPALVFVSYDGNGSTDQTFAHGVFMDDIKAVEIRSEVAAMTELITTKYVAVE